MPLHGKRLGTNALLTDGDIDNGATKSNTRIGKGKKRKLSTDNDIENEAKKTAVKNTELILCHMYSTFYAVNSEQLARHFAKVHLDHHAADDKGSDITCCITKVFGGREKVSGDIFKNILSKEKMVEVEIPGNGYCFLSSVIVALGSIGIFKVDSVLCLEIVNEAKLYYERVLETAKSHQKRNKCTLTNAALLCKEEYMPMMLWTIVLAAKLMPLESIKLLYIKRVVIYIHLCSNIGAQGLAPNIT